MLSRGALDRHGRRRTAGDDPLARDARGGHLSDRRLPLVRCRIAGGADFPEVHMLDGRRAGVNETGLREAARRWPEVPGKPHVSRSYAYPYALVAVHWAPVGVDIERVAACDERFAALICTPTERRATVVAGDRDRYLTSLWSSKEALAKVLGSPVRYEPHRLESPLAWPAEKPGLWQAQELEIDADHVAWVCWRRPFS